MKLVKVNSDEHLLLIFFFLEGGGREENMNMDLPPPGRPLLTKLDLVGIKVNRQTAHMAVETRFTDTSLRIDSFLCPWEKLLLFLEFNR